MRLGDVIKPQEQPAFSYVLNSPIWNRSVDKFSPIDLDVLFLQLRRYLPPQIAERNCNWLIAQLKQAEENGLVDCVMVREKQWVKQRVSQEYFDKHIKNFSQARADCIRFALEMDWGIESAMMLKRNEVKSIMPHMNIRAARIIGAQPICLFKNSVFWEYIGDEPRELISLNHQVTQVFKTDWESLKDQYQRSSGTFDPSVSLDEAIKMLTGDFS